MKVATTLDSQHQQSTPHLDAPISAFHSPISNFHLDETNRTPNHILVPQTAIGLPSTVIPPISPFHTPDQCYIGRTFQTYAQTIGTVRDYGMPYGMFRPPTNAVPFDPAVLYKHDSGYTPSYFGSSHALATPVYFPQGKPLYQIKFKF